MTKKHIYPTKEQILSGDVKHRPEIIRAVFVWKRDIWYKIRNTANSRERFDALARLLKEIASHYNKVIDIVFVPEAPTCSQKGNLIIINQSVSIISGLHELAHFLFDGNEFKACRWSIWLFKKTFPRAYQELTWRGHMLVKQDA